MSIEFVMIIILAGWVGINEWRLSRIEKALRESKEKQNDKSI